jgi:hypothetical protein
MFGLEFEPQGSQIRGTCTDCSAAAFGSAHFRRFIRVLTHIFSPEECDSGERLNVEKKTKAHTNLQDLNLLYEQKLKMLHAYLLYPIT